MPRIRSKTHASGGAVRPARLFATIVFVAIMSPAAGAADSWLQWGGPGRDFKTDGTRLALSWPADGPRQIWNRPLGAGYSSILVDRGVLYTMYRQEDDEIVVALDADTGKTEWEYRYPAPPLDKQRVDYGKGPNATPLIVGGRIYTVGFTSKVHCLDRTDGTLVWVHDLIEEFGGLVKEYGHSSNPIAYGDSVVVLVGGAKHAAVGFDLADGSVRWSSAPAEFDYSSPIIVEVDGEDQLIFMTPTEVIAIGMDDGAIKWNRHHENQYKVNCASPSWGDDNLLLVSSQGDVGSRTLKLTRKNDTTQVEQVARNRKVKIFHSSALRIGDYFYGSSGSYLVAHNVRTGEVAWREGGFTEANLLLAGDKVLLLDENGKLGLATMSPERLTVHATHQLLETRSWTVPTLSGTRLFVRDQDRILALDLGADRQRPASR